jgi:predicted Abi (CAAX) family protease
MDSRMSLQIAQEHIADLHRSAAAQREAQVAEQPKPAGNVIALRRAGDDEVGDLARLAGLDSARPLDGDVLVALVDGRLVAAISLADGRVIADPLAPTTEARALLHQRASQLAQTPQRPWRRFRPRFA